MIDKGIWAEAVDQVTDLIAAVDAHNNQWVSEDKHFNLNPLEMLIILDVLRSVSIEPMDDNTFPRGVVIIQELMPRYEEYTNWLAKAPGRNVTAVLRRIARMIFDFEQHKIALLPHSYGFPV